MDIEQNLENCDSHAPDVHFIGEKLAVFEDNFWSHIRQCPNRTVVLIFGTGNSKVSYFVNSVLVNNVLRLYVSVDHLFCMDLGQTLTHVANYAQELLFPNLFMFNHIPQGTCPNFKYNVSHFPFVP